MKTRALLLVASVAAAACSSTDAGSPAGSAGAASGGQSTTAGAAGTQNGAAGAATSGAGGASAGSAGAQQAGAAGTVAGAPGSAGVAGSSGAGGSGGMGGGAAGGSSTGAAGAAGEPNLPNQVPAGYTGTPFGGTPQTIPGKIEIERYDLGGLNVAFKATAKGAFNKCGFMRGDGLDLQCTGQAGSPTDTTSPGCAVEPKDQVYLGYINSGDWYKYTVNVLQAGTYVISGHEGVSGVTKMSFVFTDAMKTGDVLLPSTANMCAVEAYHVWATQNNLAEITLQPGKYVLTITSVAASMNLDWFAFTKKP